MNRKQIIDDILKDRYQCDSCLRIIGEEETEPYREQHGAQATQYEMLRRTICCRSSYQDLDAEMVSNEMQRLIENLRTMEVRARPRQAELDNYDAITIILENLLDL